MRYVIPILLCTCISAGAQAPQTVQQVLAAQQTALQAIIDATDKVPATAALIAQRTSLQNQLDAISAKIDVAEGPDVKNARRLLEQLNRQVQRQQRAPAPVSTSVK